MNWDKAAVSGIEYVNDGTDIILLLNSGEAACIVFVLADSEME